MRKPLLCEFNIGKAKRQGTREITVLKKALNHKEAAAYCGVSPNKLRQYREEGRITCFQDGRIVRYLPENLDAFLKGGQTNGKATNGINTAEGQWLPN